MDREFSALQEALLIAGENLLGHVRATYPTDAKVRLTVQHWLSGRLTGCIVGYNFRSKVNPLLTIRDDVSGTEIDVSPRDVEIIS